VPGGDTKDFVDWIRTTGPNAGQQPPTVAAAVGSNKRWSQASTGSRPGAKSNMVPRDPGVRGDSSADLADFIRSGPSGPSDARPAPTTVDKNKPLPPRVGRRSPGPGAGSMKKTRIRPKDPYAFDFLDDDDDMGDLRARGYTTALPNASSSAPTNVPAGGTRTPHRTLSSSALNKLNAADSTSRSVSPGPGQQRSASSLSNRNSHPALSGGLIQPPGSTMTRKIRLEARPAGATRGFGGHGYYYSTTDMADFLRTSGPGEMAGANGLAAQRQLNGVANGTAHHGSVRSIASVGSVGRINSRRGRFGL
jgi:hypothetical protein